MVVRFRQIFSDLADQIYRGDLPPGTQLPTERAMAALLGVNRSTVAIAYAELEAAGLVERRQGSGTWVRGDLWGVAPDWQRYIQDGAFQPTTPLLQRIREARRRPGMLDLSEGVLSPDLMPRLMLQEKISRLQLRGNLGYPHALGEPCLRDVLSRYHADRHGFQADPETVLVTGGGQQALYLITRALLRPGDAIGIEQPSYYYSLSLFQSAGIRLLPIPVDEEGARPEAIRHLYQRHRLRLVLLNPIYQNPTTTTLSHPRREQVLAICRSLNIPLVEDDSYADLALDSPRPAPLKALDREGRVIYLGTLSKIAAPALRIGWLIGPKPVIDRLADVKQQMDFGGNTIAQWLAADLLNSPGWEQHLDSLRAELRRRRDRFATRLSALFGDMMRFTLPSGGMHLWASWTGAGADQERLDQALQAGVIVAPGRLYGATDGFVRFTYGQTSESAAEEALQRLARAWLTDGLPD